MKTPEWPLSGSYVKIPAVGFGCAFGSWTGGPGMQGFLPEQAWRALQDALDVGYRHFDTAYCYGTERHLGDVLGRALREGSLKREDVFLTTKIAHPPSPPHVAISRHLTLDWFAEKDLGRRITDDFERAKEKLGVGQVDLLLMHWPGMFDNTDPVRAKEGRLEVWEAMEALRKRGDARAIGVCNFAPRHLEDLQEAGRSLPAVNQVEYHPYCQDPALSAYCREKGVLLEAYAPFASGAFGLLKDPVIEKIALELGRSTAQVILRWQIQLGHVVLPKSGNAKRMRQNLELFDFELNEEQMTKICGLQPEISKRSTAAPEDIL